MHLKSTSFALALLGTTAAADVVVTFNESAPKDSFTITNTGDCRLEGIEVRIDLAGSAAGLIFDVTGAGAGVQVFQPLELVTGRDLLSNLPEVRDGDTALSLFVTSLEPTQQIVFTIDVDDTAGRSETMVSGAEITGATASVRLDGQNAVANFDGTAKARVSWDGCNV